MPLKCLTYPLQSRGSLKLNDVKVKPAIRAVLNDVAEAIRLELEKTSTVAFSGDRLGKNAYLS